MISFRVSSRHLLQTDEYDSSSMAGLAEKADLDQTYISGASAIPVCATRPTMHRQFLRSGYARRLPTATSPRLFRSHLSLPTSYLDSPPLPLSFVMPQLLHKGSLLWY